MSIQGPYGQQHLVSPPSRCIERFRCTGYASVSSALVSGQPASLPGHTGIGYKITQLKQILFQSGISNFWFLVERTGLAAKLL